MEAENPYAAPLAAVAEVQVAPADRYYVVAPWKLVLLYIGTVGLYQIYWMYQHWAQFKRATKGSEWPVMRGLFPVFFYHSLFREIEHTLMRRQVTLAWHPGGLATGIVLLVILGGISDRLSGINGAPPALALLSLAALPVVAWCHQRAQRAANAACGDPDGAGNARLTIGNILWLLLGSAAWLILGLGALMIFGVLPDA